jgi:hypothetical protein
MRGSPGHIPVDFDDSLIEGVDLFANEDGGESDGAWSRGHAGLAQSLL